MTGVERLVGSGGVVEVFLGAVERRPSALAVRTVSESVTYGELSRLAGGVARALDAVDGDGAALLLATTGIDLAAGALGVLASGRTVVPVDPRLPPDRIAELAQTVDASAVVTSDPELVGAVGFASEVAVVATRGFEPSALEPRPVGEGSVAIVGFTSGSTGPPRPNGVAHAEIVARAGRHLRGDPAAHERLGMLLGATYQAVIRILLTLSGDGSVSCLDARTADPGDLVRAFADHDVTYLAVIPTYLRRMLDAADVAPALPSIRLLTAEGEPLDWGDVAAIRTRLSETCLIEHSYGLSETGRIARRLIEPHEPLGEGSVPVGWPFPGVAVSIESDAGEPVPDGQVGAIVVTSERIRAGVDADGLPDGRRRYRTGDLGYLLPDGQLVIVGRGDRMVKIGGIRVEPERIEAVLREVDGVREVVVLHTHGDDATARLVAHIAGDRTVERALTAHAAQRLHEAAVPTRFVWHPQGLPTLPSGKIDIVALGPTRAGRDGAAVQMPSSPPTGPE